MPARYLIGIDLGTTNSAVAYVDTRAADPRVRVFELAQLVAPGEVAARRQLPSFVYLAGDLDLAPHETALPWRPVARVDRDPQAAASTVIRPVVGELARSQGARMASRMIASAKSWLCHPGVDRQAAILPWGDSDGPKLSPVAAQALILAHVREAWDHAHPDAAFADQEILVTVPASFDEAARELTQQAAAKAGYPPIVLLEEPQAAFYAWMDAQHGARRLAAGDRVLVFDVGGGTTDFTLIDVGDGDFTRSAVGDHLLLGGDNLDLTLGKLVEQRLVARTGKKLDALQWHGLVHACRLAKEALLATDDDGGASGAAAPPASGASAPPASGEAAKLQDGEKKTSGASAPPASGEAAKLQDGEKKTSGASAPPASGEAAKLQDGEKKTSGASAPPASGEAAKLQDGEKKTSGASAPPASGEAAKLQDGEKKTSGASAPIVVQSRGAKLIGGTLRDEVTRAELDSVLFDGFFPLVAADAPLARGRGGLQEFGLPYASDPAVTRHLAAFLARHGGPPVSAILFNGGAMTPRSLRARVIAQIAAWQSVTPRELPTAMPELAVAQGAAYYGLVRRGLAIRIKGGTARAFYIGVDTGGAARMAVCLAPSGLDDGARVQLARDFRLVTNRPVSFRLYSSSSRADAPGALVPIGDGRADTIDDGSDLLELPPIVTVLRARGRGEVTVRLEVHITELGALEIACVEVPEPGTAGAAGAAGETWKLAFDMRSGGSAPTREPGDADAAAHPRADEAKAKIQHAFRTGDGLATLTRDLEAMLDARRDDWSVTTTRALFDALVEVAAERKKTPDHEQRWLNLAGFLMRPGTGAPLDAWRSRVMWGVFNEGLAHSKSEPGKLAWWITWRRIAGGLAKGQHDQIYDRLAKLLLPNPLQAKKLTEARPSKQELAEMWRVVASLERLPTHNKLKLGDELMRRLEPRKGREDSVHLWALSRIGARVPLYGPLNAVIAPARIADWLTPLCAWDWPEPDKAAFPLAQLGRRTGDRTRDLDDATRARLAAVVRAMPGGDRAAVLVEQVVELEAREERVALGDTLPAGLKLAPEARDAPPADDAAPADDAPPT